MTHEELEILQHNAKEAMEQEDDERLLFLIEMQLNEILEGMIAEYKA